MKIITISGASGSGKTTLADYIHKSKPGSLLLSIDRYYLSKAEQIDKNGFFNFDYPAALDIDLLKNHLQELRNDGQANVPIYDFTISERAGFELVTAKGTVIIEGLFAGSLLAGISDFNIFVDVDLDLALLRRIKRDMEERGRTLESVTNQYINDVRPAYFKHVAHIKTTADITLTNNQSIDQMLKDSEKILNLFR
ncbi:MAG: AAA family ATPase [Emcibacteraceae bacterium]|nr:AAA family ATPase [Emcibacteraceae bacterium]